MRKQEVMQYSTFSKSIHWLIAFIVIGMVSLSFFLQGLTEPYRGTAFLIHKSFGLTVLFLLIGRVLGIAYYGRPPLPATVLIWQRIAARGVQFSLYIFLFAMALSGWIMSVASNKIPNFFGLFYVPLPIRPNQALAASMNATHHFIAWVLIGLIVLHILGAMKHYFIDKDQVLQTMLPLSTQNVDNKSDLDRF